MGDCVRNCKRISVVEGSGSSTSMAVSKKRRIIGLTSSDLELGENCSCVESPVKTVSPANAGAENAGDLCRSFCTDQFPVSCCSSNESSEVVRESLRLIDLEVNFSKTECTSIWFLLLSVWLLRKRTKKESKTKFKLTSAPLLSFFGYF